MALEIVLDCNNASTGTALGVKKETEIPQLNTTVNSRENNLVTSIRENVLQKSSFSGDSTKKVKGYDFNSELNYSTLFKSYLTTGFQATNLGLAIDIVREMIMCNNGPKTNDKDGETCKIFLGYTSNLISSGIRESIRFLVQHQRVHVIVSSAGGVEEDFIKCLAPTYVGSFNLDGKTMRAEGLNRIGNLIVPNKNYCLFEDWIMPILDAMLYEQIHDGVNWTPSKVIHRLGKEINHEESIYFWAYKNNIPVYCPALTDGSLGDMIYFHSYKSPGLIIDIAADIRSINNEAVFATKTGMIILGGGVIKHHICNANLMRNGAEYAVFINTGLEFDGSDAGAATDEAVSWGKIKVAARMVKVHCDATIAFPILVAETFAQPNFEC